MRESHHPQAPAHTRSCMPPDFLGLQSVRPDEVRFGIWGTHLEGIR